MPNVKRFTHIIICTPMRDDPSSTANDINDRAFVLVEPGDDLLEKLKDFEREVQNEWDSAYSIDGGFFKVYELGREGILPKREIQFV